MGVIGVPPPFLKLQSLRYEIAKLLADFFSLQFEPMRTGVITKAGGEVVCARCEIASSPLLRMRGLLGRSGLDADQGMLFRPAGSIHTLFMRFPIDVVFCDRELRVIGVERELGPWRMAGRRGTKVVIELGAGAASGIEPGDRLFLAAQE
jgi:uncharacterized membrane protein (UPF0127 family)